MNDMTTTPGTDGDATTEGRERFTPDYTPIEGLRVYRSRLRPNEGGVATVTFRGDLTSATPMWIEQGTSGRPSLYAEVATTDDTATAIRIAMVPTGKRVPMDDTDSTAKRIGSVKGLHCYLLSIESVDRAEYDAEQDRRKAEREARRQAWMAAQGDDDTDDDGGVTFILGLN